MPLARLDNFLKNVRGNILYVSPNDLDSTDSIENQGNSAARPFKTIQRALIEAARFSYQKGLDNDRFGKTTILLMPGDHLIDNRPGFIPLTGTNYLQRNGNETTGFSAFDANTNFDVESPDNALYKLNSVHGGVIVPRGTSIVGYDLRKTKIRPLYVPDPTNSNIERTAIFRITGGCYFWQMTFFDGRPNGLVYKNYTPSQFVPNFSHHKVTCFEYADGVNNVYINDAFNVNKQFDRTDLDMYYEKVGLAYGPASGRTIEPDFPSSGLDIQAKVDEFRIVGPKGGAVGISTIKAGDGSTGTKTITVNLGTGAGNVQGIEGLQVDTMFQVNDCADSAYNGQFVVDSITKVDGVTGRVLEFTYQVPVIPTDALENPASATITLDTDTVKSASPYIFNISLRSVYGMCGMHADGNKAGGFKSMVVAQFTGVSLQKDDQAFIKYKTDGTFERGTPNIHSDGDAKYHPDYYSFHIKASNNSVIQIVSVFAIGYAQQFLTESGGDFSVTNSNSNFGEIALNSVSYREEAFAKDDVGYITHIIPPQEITSSNFNLEYDAIDVLKTLSVAAGAATTTKLFLAEKTNVDDAPNTLVQGYRIGAAVNDTINVGISSDITGTKNYASRISMPGTTDTASMKEFTVGRVGTANSITSDIITLTQNHTFINGETIRFISEDARLPDGLENNKVYFAITDGLNADQLKVASTFTEASAGQQIPLNNLGGSIKVQSRVSDKIVGDLGHPIQFDTVNEQWYITVPSDLSLNSIYHAIKGIGSGIVGDATSRTFITRKSDTRPLGDKIYKFRYVLPAGAGISSARQPLTSYVIEESNTVIGATNAEVALQFSPTPQTMSNQSELRNFRFIKNATTDGTFNYFTSELPHGLTLGSEVRINQVTSTVNPIGIANSGYNQKYTVVSVPKSDQFVVQMGTQNPGTFSNNTSQRNTSLPNFNRVKAPNNYFIYDVNTINEYKTGVQDGVYYLTIVDATNTPTIAPYNDRLKFAFPQPIKDLFPQYDRDNPNSNPDAATAYASSRTLGNVEIDDPKHSLTRFVASQGQVDLAVGFGITDIVSNSAGTAHTIFTKTEHGLNRITNVSLVGGAPAGQGYGNNTGSVESLYNATLTGGNGVDASARITVNSSGAVTNVEIMNPGSDYLVGDLLTITGTSTFSPFVSAQVRVDNILNNVGDTIRVENITSFERKEYNKLYEITGISTNKELQVTSIGGTITNPSFTGIGVTVTSGAFGTLTGIGLTVDNTKFVYDNTSGIATVTTLVNHGFRASNQITIDGSSASLFNGDFIVKKIVGLTTFTVDIGKNDTTPSISGTVRAYTPGLIPQPGIINLFDENFGGRVLNVYDNLTAQLSSPVSTLVTDEINITNLNNFDFKIGDYVRIDDEIMRIKTSVTSNPVKVFRGLMGTKTATHISGSVVRRVLVEPIELRRPSIIRASGHTFEYLGFGPGNYSTALPEKQSKQPTTKEQLATQSFNSAGGITVFTGMNDRGDFFVGNKKISSNTGKEEVFDTPIPTVTGEDIFSVGTDTGIDIINPAEVTVSRAIKVEGGNTGSLLSQFDGPVLFNKKITSTSPEGIEANHVFIQGDATVSRKYSVGIATPTTSATAGDVVWKAQPEEGSHWGWVYTTDNEWYPFGNISIDKDKQIYIFDGVGVGTTSPGTNTFQVGSGTSLVAIDGNGGVGIGTTANGYDIRTNGDGIFVGSGGTYFGDGSGLYGLLNDSLFSGVTSGLGTGIHPISNFNVGIGTTVFDDTFTLQIGSPGTGKTDLLVNNQSRFLSTATYVGDVSIVGKLEATNFDINSSSSNITVGVLTATSINIGVGGTILTTTANGVGIGSTQPSAALDVTEPARIQSTYDFPQTVESSSNTITLKVDEASTFLHTTIENVNKFVLQGIKAGSSASFTIKIVQNATTARTVAVDNFETTGGVNIPVNWPGGVVPVMTNAVNAIDVYSYITFDGGTSLYGIVGGQNFS
tara:strand:- start:5426 stop:11323 length:5898 start_codon:yes stop_codon:yes gene_type:complete